MVLRDEILVNKFGQGIVEYKVLLERFNLLGIGDRSKYLNDLLFLILQSKPTDNDVNSAITESGLKPTFTPCVLLHKGISTSNLKKIIELPDNEQEKVFKLFLYLFKISYIRKFMNEKNHPDKWWYWDFLDEENQQKLKNRFTELD